MMQCTLNTHVHVHVIMIITHKKYMFITIEYTLKVLLNICM